MDSRILTVAGFTQSLKDIASGGTTLGRLYALKALAEIALVEKKTASERFALLLDAIFRVDDFLKRYYQSEPDLISWPIEYHPEKNRILVNGVIDSSKLASMICALEGLITESISGLLAVGNRTPLLTPVIPVLSSLNELLSKSKQHNGTLRLNYANTPKNDHEALRVLWGPRSYKYDKTFQPTYSLLDQLAPDFGTSALETAPYFWTLAIRESTAAALCCLCAIEYDNLPRTFYRDMAKQAWDEMRHSVYYYETSVSLLPELLEQLPPNHALAPFVRKFMKKGVGLPVPNEWGLYEAILNGSLVERLILLQLRTETPAIRRLKKKLKSPFCESHPDICTAIEIDMRDEISHSTIGKKWLSYLLPSRVAYRDALAQTDMMRSVLMLTCFATHTGTALKTLMNKFSQGELAPGAEGWSGKTFAQC